MGAGDVLYTDKYDDEITPWVDVKKGSVKDLLKEDTFVELFAQPEAPEAEPTAEDPE